MCQFVDISNQMEQNDDVSNLGNNFFFPKFDTSPFFSIWLEIYTNWHTKNQGPEKYGLILLKEICRFLICVRLYLLLTYPVTTTMKSMMFQALRK